MLIRIGFDLAFDLPASVSMLLMLYTHPCRSSSLLAPETIHSSPPTPINTFIDQFGNRCGRIAAAAGELRLWHESVVRDSGLPDPVHPEAAQSDIHNLPLDVVPFLFASRYCETDHLSNIAWGLFGNTPPGWPRAQAVCDWVHNNVQFGYEFARPTKSAHEVYQERRGVCRDFSHLLITFLRCLNIPARYVTGYLGDIGVPQVPDPMDFSAWTEVFLDGRWYTFDARHNMPRIGRIVMARGRDAVDVAITTSFGPSTLKKFIVITDEIPRDEDPAPKPLNASAPPAAAQLS
ncbi:MAG TPA: transglutaminase family protein [Tepidisphaeraceae bacterium]|jgi:transglutaminase-like putative cysteine protease|nr:transglutaminase family protein [Tepidisphaeraceae bacterium]